MSYNGDDKWSVYGDELVGVSTKTLAELKSILKKHIESFEVDKMTTVYSSEDYEVTNVRFSIKKKRD